MVVIKREVKLCKCGNSKVIQLTKDVLEEAGLNEGDNVVFELEIEPNKIILTRESELTSFQQLFAAYNGRKSQKEAFWDEAEPVGNEI